jgi:hypothetical protein
MKIKWKRLTAVCLCALLIGALTGCSLALKDGAEISSDDGRLIGVFLTPEPLDLFDGEAYLRGEAQTQRLYAELREKTLTDAETGEPFTIAEYEFPDVEGVSFFAAQYTERDGGAGYISSGSDEAISDAHMSVISRDDGDRIELTGTLYITTGGSVQWYFNPVCQLSDGRVYVTPGTGAMMDADGEGVSFSQKLEETKTITENGASKTVSALVEISLSVLFPPEEIVISQYDENGLLLSRESCIPGNLPETLTPPEETAFLVVETHKAGPSGKAAVSRELYERDAQTLSAFYARPDGVCCADWTALDWPPER